MTVHSYSEYAMLKAGAFEVLPKDKAVHELYSSIQRAVASILPVVILKDAPLPEDAPSVSEQPTSQQADEVVEEADHPQQKNNP